MTQKVPTNWQRLLDGPMIDRAIARIAYEIVERDRHVDKLAIVGIRTCGEILARRLQREIERIEGITVPLGAVDITLYRDDLELTNQEPTHHSTELPFAIDGSHVILVDDILFTGRTVRAALDAVLDFGRPERVELACLINRGQQEVPVRADYVGRRFDITRPDMVKVKLREQGFDDGVYRVPRGPR